MKKALVAKEVLTSAVEGDSELYTIVWALRSFYPIETDANLIEAARKEILSQLHNGWLRVYRSPDWYSREYAVLPNEEAQRVLAQDIEFHPPPTKDDKSPRHSITATELGKTIWESGSPWMSDAEK